MTVPWYPPELPRPNRDNYRLARGEARSVGRNDAGPPTRRKRFSAVTRPLTFSTDLSLSQKGRFDRFYIEDTKHGTLPFLMRDHAVHGTPLLDHAGAPILTSAGEPILVARTWLCVFDDQLPTEIPRGVEWRLTFSLLVLP